MAINYLVLSYPNFTLGQIIDPDEANQNNSDIANKVNEFVDEVEQALATTASADAKADSAILTADGAVLIANTKGDEAIGIANGAVVTANSAVITANEADTKSDVAVISANEAVATADTALGQDTIEPYTGALGAMKIATDIKEDYTVVRQEVLDAVSGGLDDRYITRSEVNLENNIDIIYEVYTIVNADNGNGTFIYQDNDSVQYIGDLVNGNQVFQLIKGDYTLGENRISAYINDTLHRSSASGGLVEIDSTHIGITPEGDGAEITIKYITISGSLGNGIVIGLVEPVEKYIGKVWIDTGGV